MKAVVDILKKINPWKTIYFNFHYFPFNVAIKFPFFIYWRTKLYKMEGEVIIDAPIKSGLVRFGTSKLGTQDILYSRSIWEVKGKLIIKGHANIGRGTKISVGKKAKLTLGSSFHVSGDTAIISQKEITFGNDCLLSWDILIMDTDFHSVTDKDGNTINSAKPIIIGDHVWIGCRNTILKGVTIASNCIISANSTVTKSTYEEGCAIGGHGKDVVILKKSINWKV